MSILDHVWGESPAADRVWSHVSGMRPSAANRCPIMVLQAFIDDSYKPESFYVLAGFVSTAETWAKFAKDWEEMLPLGTLDSKGNFHFKMSEMAQSSERMERVGSFYRVIENHNLVPLGAQVKFNDIENAKSRIWSPDTIIDWRIPSNPFFICYRCLMDSFHQNREIYRNDLPIDLPVDFIFDQQGERKLIIEGWENYIASRPEEFRNRFGSTPRFEDDKKFLGLQAADFCAWWTRKWAEEDKPSNPDGNAFAQWPSRRKGKVTQTVVGCDEADIVINFLAMLRATNPNGTFFDLKYSPEQDEKKHSRT